MTATPFVIRQAESCVEVTLSDALKTNGKKIALFRFTPDDGWSRDDFLVQLHEFIKHYWEAHGGGIEAMNLHLLHEGRVYEQDQ